MSEVRLLALILVIAAFVAVVVGSSMSDDEPVHTMPDGRAMQNTDLGR